MGGTGTERPRGQAAAFAALACPSCSGSLAAHGGEVVCGGCGRRYATVAGIPDLRLAYPEPNMTRERDTELACELAACAGKLGFGDLLREHWRLLGKNPELAGRFTARELAATHSAGLLLDAIEHERGRPIESGERFLDAGCGAAALAAAAALRGAEAWGSDVSLRWLVLARKRLEEEGATVVRLVCCDGERPALSAEGFDVVAATDVIEHVARPEQFLAGCWSLLRPGGLLFLATPNRFSVGLEPHVRLWGVGYLPRPLARRYVSLVRKTSYDHVHLLSARGLRGRLEDAGFDVRLATPEIPRATRELYRGPELALVHAYNRLRRLPGARTALLGVGPFFHVFARKPIAASISPAGRR